MIFPPELVGKSCCINYKVEEIKARVWGKRLGPLQEQGFKKGKENEWRD